MPYNMNLLVELVCFVYILNLNYRHVSKTLMQWLLRPMVILEHDDIISKEYRIIIQLQNYIKHKNILIYKNYDATLYHTINFIILL